MLSVSKNVENTLQSQELERTMLKEDPHKVIKELYDKGMAKREIARFMGIDIKTVRNHLRQGEWRSYQRARPKTLRLLQEERDWLQARMAEVNYNATILFRELKLRGYQGSYETVKLFVYPHRPVTTKGTVRYETEPGQQSQVDWGSAWVWLDDKNIKVHFFSLVLGYSRRFYAKGFLDERFVNLVNGHESAFTWFGGITQEILYDNAKTMITTHNVATRELVLNASFKDFAQYYGFEPRFCRPYRPQTKGKIESGVKYLKRNFLPGRRFTNLTHLNHELEHWITHTADQRLHGTTHQRPCDRFADEKLFALQRAQPYVFVPVVQRKVSQDSMISWANNRYSVPWTHVGQCVNLTICDGYLMLSVDDKVIAKHEVLQGKYQQSVCQQHYAGLIGRSPQQRLTPPQYDPYWKNHVDVEVRDLALYEKACFVSPSSAFKH